jgi:tetratricopeptide (TPR) repeat protein
MSDDNNKALATKYKIKVPATIDFKETVLVVEDQTDLRLIIAHQLQKQSFSNVKQATNGYDAIEQMKIHEIQSALFVCDMDMPVLGGIDFLTELRENPSLSVGPFCLAMDNVSKEKIMLAVESGADEILVKPFTLADIFPKLKSAFAKFHNPNNPEKIYQLAKSRLKANDLALAEAIYADLTKSAPKAARPVVGLARIEAKKNNLEKALEFLDQAKKKNENFVHTYHEKALIYCTMNEWDKAIDNFKTAIKLSPLNPIRYRSAADILFKVKRWQEAADMLETAIKCNLDFPDLYNYLSQAKFALKDYKSAQKYIKQALSSNPENVGYLNQLGICLKETDQFDEATKVYNQVIKLEPDNAAALYNKSVLLHAKGESDEAIKLLERLLKKQPNFAQAATKLAEYKAAKPAA